MTLRDQLQSSLGGSYRLERELGGGGMSRVFVAEETRLRRKVVVKVLSPELAAGVSAERFERELQLAASLQQANIVPVLSAGEMNGLPYYTMPFVDGESLRARIARDGQLPIGDVVSVLRDVTRALGYAHARGVVHRDIKPDNVLLSGGTAVVTDFGIAKALAAAGQAQREGGATLTQLGTAIGTPAYMAPEQVAGDPEVDRRADIYALGCMAYELLSGAAPFANRTPQRMLAAHMTEEPRPVLEMRADTPPQLADLVMWCLSKEPLQRPQSAGEISQVLDAVATAGTFDAIDAHPARASTRRAMLTYGAIAAGIIAVAKGAELALGLPNWVFNAAVGVVLGGLAVTLFTAITHRTARKHVTTMPVRTPHGTPVAMPASTLTRAAVRASPHLRWSRLARGGAYVLAAFVAIVAVYLGLGAAGIGPGASLLAAGKMDANAKLLVAEFRVQSGPDTALGGIVAEALRTDLGQSSAISVVSPTAVGQALQRMKRPPGTAVDSAIAREMAEREGISVIVAGTIAPLSAGPHIITARLIDASNGSALAVVQETADAREIIEATERIARKLREEIGESLKDVRASPPLAQVTTSSLPALRKYAEGVRAAEVEGDYPKAISLLREAVALDSNFAMAWRKLGVSLSNYGMPGSDSAAIKAYELRGRLTETEAAAAVGYYYQRGPGGDRAKAVEAYESVVAKGIVDASTHNLALLLTSRREFARAESLYKRRITAGDAPVVTYGNLVSVLFSQGKIDEADSVRRIADGLFPTAPQSQGSEMAFVYHRGQLDSVAIVTQRMRSHRDPRTQAAGWYSLSALQLLRGQVREGTRSLATARQIDSARGSAISPVQDSIYLSFVDLMVVGNRDRAVQRFERAMARLGPGAQDQQRTYFYVAADMPRQARQMYERWLAEPRDSAEHRLLEPNRHGLLGAVLMVEGKPLEAIEELRRAELAPDGPVGSCAACGSVRIGQAFDRANMPDSAIARFEHYLNTPIPGRLNFDLDVSSVPSISRRLGELYEAKGDRVKAAAYYQKFIDLWKNADPELQPQVAEIRQRLARLTDPERGGRR